VLNIRLEDTKNGLVPGSRDITHVTTNDEVLVTGQTVVDILFIQKAQADGRLQFVGDDPLH
jgi:hypothetical protein